MSVLWFWLGLLIIFVAVVGFVLAQPRRSASHPHRRRVSRVVNVERRKAK